LLAPSGFAKRGKFHAHFDARRKSITIEAGLPVIWFSFFQRRRSMINRALHPLLAGLVWSLALVAVTTDAAEAQAAANASSGTSATVAPITSSAFPAVTQSADGVSNIGFEHLASYAYPMPSDSNQPKPGSTDGIPGKVRELDGKRVCIEGYMLPMKLNDGLVNEFLLIRSPMVCCYGAIPATNEWVVVKMKTGTSPVMDVPIKLYGTLHVGAVYEDTSFAGLYAVDGEKVAPK
jgi:hypothetical protein